ncbi:hypothetical protein OHS70_38055 [Streptomyces sp. NBC_00390]|uniref:hypothetical protein n=1 Tax=Streptomyces sp. NBC_00390 TaxID=2975736 RepID=UPI002E1F55A8
MTFDDASDSLVVITPGRYLLKGSIVWSYTPSSAATLQLSIIVNDTVEIANVEDAEGSGTKSQDVFGILELNTGDVISLEAFQNTGANAQSLPIDDRWPLLQAELVEP